MTARTRLGASARGTPRIPPASTTPPPGDGCSVSQTLFVDHSTAVPLADQDGGLCTPFATIQQALDVTNEIDVWSIICAPGIYDEDLTVPARIHVRVSSWGGTSQVLGAEISTSQAVSGMLFLGPPDLTSIRNITWNSPGPPPDLVPFFEFQGFISGQIIVTDGGVENSDNMLIVTEYVSGVDSTGHDTGTLRVRFEGANLQGPVLLSDTTVVLHVRNSWFGDVVQAHIMEEVTDSIFQAGFDCSPAGVTASAKLFNTQTQGTITNCDNLIVDGASEYWHRFLSGAVPFAGSTTAYIRADDPLETDVSITSAESPYTINPGDASTLFRVIYCDSTTGEITVELPIAPVRGDEFKVKDSGGAATTNNITLDGNGNTIDGQATQVMASNYKSLWVKWNLTAGEWSIL